MCGRFTPTYRRCERHELYVPQWRGDATSKNRGALVASLRRSNSGQPSPDAYARARNSRKIAQPTFVAIGRSPIRLTHVTLQIGYRATVPALAHVRRFQLAACENAHLGVFRTHVRSSGPSETCQSTTQPGSREVFRSNHGVC
jgi:hypothetical protein